MPASADDPVAGDHRDELPEELDAIGYVGPYTFPDNKRRRVPAVLYLATGAALLSVWTTRGDAVLSNRGFLVCGVALVLIGGYHLVAGYPLRINETDALAAAAGQVGFAVGHASAQLGWRGLRSRPTWRILLYSAEDPPASRGLVLVDGVNGDIVAHFVEENPEDWSEFTPAERAGRTIHQASGD